MMKDKIKQIIAGSIDVKNQLLADDVMIQKINDAANEITTSLQQEGRIYFCGNGGSAADAQHLAAELSGRFYLDRQALPAEALHCNTSYLTAVANDYSFDVIYARLVEGICRKGDVLIGFSTSGNSANIVSAFQAARRLQVKTIGFTGNTGGSLRSLSDILLNMPSVDTPRIQEAHILVGHIICQLVEEIYFSNGQ